MFIFMNYGCTACRCHIVHLTINDTSFIPVDDKRIARYSPWVIREIISEEGM